MSDSLQVIAPGIWRFCIGRPERLTPLRILPFRPASERLSALPQVDECPFQRAQISFRQTARGCEIHLPLGNDEQIYGLGLQLMSFNQTGLKKTLRVNSDPRCDLGDSHAPVPFYVTTGGYGVLVDTARYATFYCGSTSTEKETGVTDTSRGILLDTESLYASRPPGGRREMIIEIPAAQGADLYVFAGPSLGDAVRRYNLFSGGGCMPPRWALGHWYRTRGDFDSAQVVDAARQLRKEGIPCDVIGVEPGWQSHAYACSHIWSDKFSEPQEFVSALGEDHFHVNLWTHPFTHSASPLYQHLLAHSGKYLVFGGLVPDLLSAEGRRIFAEHYRRMAVDIGVSGFKIDECDNSDFIHTPWSFPELDEFPSGLDGEQMHSVFGLLLQAVASEIYRSENRRTFGLVRNSHALAAAHPFALYSDLYDHRQFVRGIANASFSGLLWCPEIRESASGGELVRRLQTGVVSPLLQVNGWYIAHPPWKQWDIDLNNQGELLTDQAYWQDRCRSAIELRMRLIPYIQSACFQYWLDGTPPFRALVVDYPAEKECWAIDDQVLVGDRVMAAPFLEDSDVRRLWLPPGEWADFWTGELYSGRLFLDYRAEDRRLPLFVKAGSILPLARPAPHTEHPDSFQIEAFVYGDGTLPATLVEEASPGLSFDRQRINLLHLSRDAGHLVCHREDPLLPPLYSVLGIRFLPENAPG